LGQRDPLVRGDGGADEHVVAGEVDGAGERYGGQVAAVGHPQARGRREVAGQREDELGGGEAERVLGGVEGDPVRGAAPQDPAGDHGDAVQGRGDRQAGVQQGREREGGGGGGAVVLGGAGGDDRAQLAEDDEAREDPEDGGARERVQVGAAQPGERGGAGGHAEQDDDDEVDPQRGPAARRRVPGVVRVLHHILGGFGGAVPPAPGRPRPRGTPPGRNGRRFRCRS